MERECLICGASCADDCDCGCGGLVSLCTMHIPQPDGTPAYVTLCACCGCTFADCYGSTASCYWGGLTRRARVMSALLRAPKPPTDDALRRAVGRVSEYLARVAAPGGAEHAR